MHGMRRHKVPPRQQLQIGWASRVPTVRGHGGWRRRLRSVAGTRVLAAVVLAVVAWPLTGETQPAGKAARIGGLETTLNGETANALGLTISPSLLVRADEVIQ